MVHDELQIFFGSFIWRELVTDCGRHKQVTECLVGQGDILPFLLFIVHWCACLVSAMRPTYTSFFGIGTPLKNCSVRDTDSSLLNIRCTSLIVASLSSLDSRLRFFGNRIFLHCLYLFTPSRDNWGWGIFALSAAGWRDQCDDNCWWWISWWWANTDQRWCGHDRAWCLPLTLHLASIQIKKILPTLHTL